MLIYLPSNLNNLMNKNILFHISIQAYIWRNIKKNNIKREIKENDREKEKKEKRKRKR